jgi:hypothetical protein
LAQIFPKWTNALPLLAAVTLIVAASAVVGFFWYYGSPQYTDVGYHPKQPVTYSHKLHAGDLGIDCRYCHTTVEVSAKAAIPPTQTCMNCHSLVAVDSASLKPIRESWATGKPMEWVRVHKLADYAYFDHRSHITKGIGCVSCHGRVDEMVEVTQEKPLSMGWCLDCHRNPDKNLRPLDQITNMSWQPGENQAEMAAKLKQELNIAPSEDCSTCHR